MKILMLLIRNVHFSALNADCSLVTKLCPTLCNPMDCNRPGFPALHHLLEFAQTHVHCFSDASNHLVLCHSFLLLPSIFPSIRVFSNIYWVFLHLYLYMYMYYIYVYMCIYIYTSTYVYTHTYI